MGIAQTIRGTPACMERALASKPAQTRRLSALAVVCSLAAAKLLIQLLAAHNYGYFRDELYFLDCSRRLAWGYVDFPPFVAGMAALSRALFGDSLIAVRLFPAISGAAKVLLVGLMARELGGNRFAQGLAALSALVAPAYLGSDHLLTMNTFEQLFWAAGAYLLIHIIKTGNPHWWLVFGVVAGLGLENKYSMVFFGFGIAVGLLLTRQRRVFLGPWVWLGALAALIIILPNLIWQFHHGLPTFEWLLNHAHASSNVPLTPLEFLGEQILALNPLALPIWAGGLWFYLHARRGEPYRLLGWAYLAILALMLILRARVYYLFPAYPMLLAGGAVFIEKWMNRSRGPWLKPAYAALLLPTGAVLAPSLLPILPVKTYIRYASTFNLDPPKIENRKLGMLPQLYADMFGWREMTSAVARQYQILPSNQRAATAIFAKDYGEAAALDWFGRDYGLPVAISPDLNYYDWGPRNYTGKSIILLGHNPLLERECSTVQQVGSVQNIFAMPRENFPLLLCRNLKQPLANLWPQLKDWQ
jgi:hypothetical protein